MKTPYVRPIVLVHGGVNAPRESADGCESAAAAGLRRLVAGGSALDAAVAAVRALEDDGRFNAGRGAAPRLDGETMEMDAAVAISDGRYAGVAAVSGVPNPILVAERLLDAPPRILAGDGAHRFAARHGLTALVRPSASARERFLRVARLASRGALSRAYGRWAGFDLARNWNFVSPMPDYAEIARASEASDPTTPEPADTVGAVVRDSNGLLVAAASTGGTLAMLAGRVGDTPILGAGLYAGPAGAVTVTGEGEEILTRLLSRAIYDRLARGETPADACRTEVEGFPDEITIGAIALTCGDHGAFANRFMPIAHADQKSERD